MLENTTGLNYQEYNISWPDGEYVGKVNVIRLYKRKHQFGEVGKRLGYENYAEDLVDFEIIDDNGNRCETITMLVDEFKNYIVHSS